MALIECEARVMCESVLERQKVAGREAAVNLDGCVYLCSSSNGYYGYMPVQRQWECAMDTSEPERQLVQSTAVVISGSSPAASRRRKHSSAGDAQLASKRARHEEASGNRYAPQPPTRLVQYPRCIMGHLI